MLENLKSQWKRQHVKVKFVLKIMIPKKGMGVKKVLNFYIGKNIENSFEMFSMNIKLYIERKKFRSCRLRCGLIMIPCVWVWRNPLARPRPVEHRLSCFLVLCHLHLPFCYCFCRQQNHFIATGSLLSQRSFQTNAVRRRHNAVRQWLNLVVFGLVLC